MWISLQCFIILLTLKKMAPERPLSRMAIKILCPCLAPALALFCKCCLIEFSFISILIRGIARHENILCFANAVWLNFFISILIRARSPALSVRVVRRGWGSGYFGAGRMAKGTVCPCWSRVLWELALFWKCYMIEFSLISIRVRGIAQHGNLLCFANAVWINFFISILTRSSSHV